MLQADEQNQPTGKARDPDSSGKSSEKAQHGGKRAGAGRPPNLPKRLLRGLSRASIAEAVAPVDVGAVIVGLLQSKRERTRLETLIFVRDTLIGRPAQTVQHSGGVLHAHAIFRPLADLTDEELRLLDTITKKLTSPAGSESSDRPQPEGESSGGEKA